ncbi:putative 4-hydroxybenzoate polyprenyltransferase [Paenibacillus larvae subsp. larvae]|uniref:4-hydroxybenzoate polyprenyltransferase n=2 Tax=Paenibacillus larvae TaxID=1464 RepID=A0A2L1UC98_9BACL|nr:putative 4-hydroxybenzoate polyprenyltransferase [Paenibacillus larvae subsp. larvae]AVF30557.1 putative 4-hydroxybenzoate polyprenyltransferase [Paenibacillus larvae subsp. larvae]
MYMWKKFITFLEMIKFEHTLFALPFAFMGTLLGAIVETGALPTWWQIWWITVAMVGARTAAMSLNRLIDKNIDARNPRTAGRALPAGLISNLEVIIYIVASFGLLFWATYHLNVLSMKLLPIAVFFVVLYSYTKRFTWLCHFVLGITLGFAPLGGWVAVTGEMSAAALILFITVVFWSAGFDIVYACQDEEFDRKEGLHSIPSRFGIPKALWIARILHVLTAVGLVSLFFITNLSWVYLIGILIAYVILFYEHKLVSPDDLSKLNQAFFTMNGILSTVVFVFTCMDLFVAGG